MKSYDEIKKEQAALETLISIDEGADPAAALMSFYTAPAIPALEAGFSVVDDHDDDDCGAKRWGVICANVEYGRVRMQLVLNTKPLPYRGGKKFKWKVEFDRGHKDGTAWGFAKTVEEAKHHVYEHALAYLRCFMTDRKPSATPAEECLLLKATLKKHQNSARSLRSTLRELKASRGISKDAFDQLMLWADAESLG